MLLPRVFQRVFFQTKVTTTWSFAWLTAYCWLYSCMPGLLFAGSRWCSPEVLQAPRPTERAQQGRAGCVWASCHLCSHLEHTREYFLYCGLKKKSGEGPCICTCFLLQYAVCLVLLNQYRVCYSCCCFVNCKQQKPMEGCSMATASDFHFGQNCHSSKC